MERRPTYGPKENPNRAVELAETELWTIFKDVAVASIERAEQERKGITNSTIPRMNEIAHDANLWLSWAEGWEADEKRRYVVRGGVFKVFILDGAAGVDPLEFVDEVEEARNQDGEDTDPDEDPRLIE